MNKVILFSTLIITFFLASCSSNSTNENDSIVNNKLVKREYVSDNHNIEYRYNENNLLTKIIDIQLQEDIDFQRNYTYDSNNNIIGNYFESYVFDRVINQTYSYDNNKIISSFSTINDPYVNYSFAQTFSYSNNIITVTTTYDSGSSSTVTLETNNSGLITKFSESNSYSLLSYDSNRNISEINVYDIDGNLTHTSEYIYDNYPNPFYGQLKSIYLPIILICFKDNLSGEFVWDGYDGYYYPYLKNNITSIRENGIFYRNYNYLYDNDNYPINVIEVFDGNNVYEYNIEY